MKTTRFLSTRFLLAAGVSLAMALIFSCSGDSSDGGGSDGGGSDGGGSDDPVLPLGSDAVVSSSIEEVAGLSSSSGSACVNPSSYGSFNTVTIDGKTWMAENLNYAACGSKCYNDDPANCTTYGRLYDWALAMNLPSSCNSSVCSGQIQPKHRGVCPSGWHIPSDDEWTALINFVGGSSTAGTHLKATSGWNSKSNGLDTYGFEALPGHGGVSGCWWSSTEGGSYSPYPGVVDGPYAYYRYVHSNGYEKAGREAYSKIHMLSIRCVKDDPLSEPDFTTTL